MHLANEKERRTFRKPETLCSRIRRAVVDGPYIGSVRHYLYFTLESVPLKHLRGRMADRPHFIAVAVKLDYVFYPEG